MRKANKASLIPHSQNISIPLIILRQQLQYLMVVRYYIVFVGDFRALMVVLFRSTFPMCVNDMEEAPFDQYTQRPSTKYQEHDRRKGKTSPNVHVTLSMTAHGAQQDFLTNEHNKNQFIVLLMEALESDGHCVKQAEDDADRLIVSPALYSLPDLCPVVVVADDTDVFVMMIYHFSSDMHNMYFFSEAAAQSKKAMRYISVRDVQQKIGCDLARRIIFLHG